MRFRPVSVAVVAAIAVLASLAPALAGAKGGGTKIYLHSTKLGKILVNSRGYTLYAFTADKLNKDRCVSINPQCLVAWPPVTTSGGPIAGPGVKKSLLGTIKLGKKLQVTYAGQPLYTYVADTHKAQTTYVNFLQFGGRWPALNASGKQVK